MIEWRYTDPVDRTSGRVDPNQYDLLTPCSHNAHPLPAVSVFRRTLAVVIKPAPLTIYPELIVFNGTSTQKGQFVHAYCGKGNRLRRLRMANVLSGDIRLTEPLSAVEAR